MSKHTGFMKRYLTYRAIRGAGKAGREAAGCGMGVFKLLLMICGLLIICFVFPYVLIAIAAVALVVLVVWLIRRKKKAGRAMPLGSDLRRDAEIVRDCQELINKSANLETVASRYDFLVSKLSEMQKRPQADFDYYGVDFGVPISSVLASLESNKAVIFCQAIDRAFAKCKKHIDGLKTEKGKQNALYKFHCESREIILRHNLPSVCSAHLDEIISVSL